MPISHLKTDGKELNDMRNLCMKVVKKIDEMKADDKKAKQ